MNEKKYILPVVFLFLVFGLLNAQNDDLEVWPGDVNNNGIVNGVDVLYWSIASGARGPRRDDNGRAWEGADAEAWNISFPDGINYAFADCDGNGNINNDDLNIIKNHFLRKREDYAPDRFTAGAEGVAPPLKLSSDEKVITAGESIDVDILLGDAAVPVDDFFGITFTIPYNPELKRRGQKAMFELERRSWLGMQTADVREFTHDDEASGRTHITVYRTKRLNTPASGGGKIGVYSIIVVEDIALGIQNIDLGLEDVKMVSLDLTEQPVAPDSLTLVVGRSTITSRDPVPADDPRLQVFPNPVTQQATVYWNGDGAPISRIEIVNAVGQTLRVIQPGAATEKEMILNLEMLPAGLYILRVHTREGMITKKLNKQQ